MMQEQKKPITFDMILDDFINSQQAQLNTVRVLIKTLREKNDEINYLKSLQTPVSETPISGCSQESEEHATE